MANVLIVAYLLIVLALIAVILLQRSEGGGLGMGSSSAGIMTARGSANLLTRTTAILAVLFMATAIGLTINSGIERGSSSILAGADTVGEGAGSDITVLDRLNQISGAGRDDSLAVPQTPLAETAPAAPAAEPAAPADDPALAVPQDGAAQQPSAEGTPAAPVN